MISHEECIWIQGKIHGYILDDVHTIIILYDVKNEHKRALQLFSMMHEHVVSYKKSKIMTILYYEIILL